MNRQIRDIDMNLIDSFWHKNILMDWKPDLGYIDFIKNSILKNEYISPIIVVKENSKYIIVNGHHRFYAHLKLDKKRIKAIVIDGTFAETEPLRKAEVLLKEFDQKTEYKFQFSGYLDRWAASLEKYNFINKYRPTLNLTIYQLLSKMYKKIKEIFIKSGK